ncbi:MAG TPA: hemerythrin domain-containing protein [Segeticoccus sp.]|nr:hemerythrin domain-containing protein [Segeticoccus sp.]
MRATDVLAGHHDELRALLARLTEEVGGERARATGAAGQPDRDLVDQLMVELTLHEMIEDEIFYPAVSELSALVPSAHAEHRQLADQLATVLRTPPGTARFAEEASALRQAVEGHAGEEEQLMFPEVDAKLDEERSAEIGEALVRRLAHLRASRRLRARLALKRTLVRHTPVTGRAG